jgi:hypothetical protein
VDWRNFAGVRLEIFVFLDFVHVSMLRLIQAGSWVEDTLASSHFVVLP